MSFQKYAGAFADGELDVQQNLEALEHLNMCPQCAQRVTEIGNCKDSLKRIWGESSAPMSLRDRITNNISTTQDTSSRTNVSMAGDDAMPERRQNAPLLARFALPLSLAASLVLATYLGWQGFSKTQTSLEPGSMTVISARLVADAREQHRQCLKHGSLHHDKSLSRNLPAIAKTLSDRLELSVIAPDLASEDFELLGADVCGIRGRRGAHVLYESPSARQILSVFSIARVADLSPNRNINNTHQDYFISTDDDELTTLAWHRGGQTYAVCAPMAESRLVSMFEDSRQAWQDSSPSAAILATAGRFPG